MGLGILICTGGCLSRFFLAFHHYLLLVEGGGKKIRVKEIVVSLAFQRACPKIKYYLGILQEIQA